MAWAHGLCSCCHDMGTCCVASCIPCVTFGETAEMTGQGGCFLYGCLAFVPCLSIFLLCQQRGIIREQENIEGSGVEDCCAACCCTCCAVIQHHNTAKESQNQK